MPSQKKKVTVTLCNIALQPLELICLIFSYAVLQSLYYEQDLISKPTALEIKLPTVHLFL